MARGNHQQRVTVGGSSGDDLGTDQRVATAAVVDDDVLSQFLGHHRRQQAADDVVGTARRIRHHQAHRARREGLGCHRDRGGSHCGGEQCARQGMRRIFHDSPLGCGLCLVHPKSLPQF